MDTFKSVAKDWMKKGCPPRKGGRALSERTVSKMQWILDDKLCPALGNRPIDAIEPPELLKVLRKVESEGKHETARRCRQIASRIFRYAVRTGRATRDPAADLEDALTPPTVTHRPAITDPKTFGALLRTIASYGGQPATRRRSSSSR